MMNKKILPEIKQSAVFKNKNTKSGIFENMDIFKSNKSKVNSIDMSVFLYTYDYTAWWRLDTNKYTRRQCQWIECQETNKFN